MNIILYIIAFLEGFTTLSVEIMAIRNSIAIIGSNAIATSIILGIILLALSYGYYRGGVYAAEHTETEIKRKIFFNLLIASIFYTFISFPFENTLLEYFLTLGIGYFFPIVLGISILFILPVFLASQTIPLLSELIQHEKKSIVLGKLLFFSTIGSFLGSVVTSLVFFAYIGVEKSIIINGVILALLATTILAVYYHREASRWMVWGTIGYLSFLLFGLFSDFTLAPKQLNVIHKQSSEYNDITVYDNGTYRLFSMNGSNSSGLNIATGKSYFEYIQDITAIIDREQPKRILVIGAAGFTLPQDIASREYIDTVDVCDIDGSLDSIAEEYFLQEKLNPKIVFSKESARYFINKKIALGEKYDFIFIDAYNGKISIPSELLTEEFFKSIARISNGSITMNVIMDTSWSSDFAKKLSNTLGLALRSVYVQSKDTVSVAGGFDNFIISTTAMSGYESLITYNTIGHYTDNLNTLEKDKYDLFYTAQTN